VYWQIDIYSIFDSMPNCLYQDECKLLLINCGVVIQCRARSEADDFIRLTSVKCLLQ